MIDECRHFDRQFYPSRHLQVFFFTLRLFEHAPRVTLLRTAVGCGSQCILIDQIKADFRFYICFVAECGCTGTKLIRYQKFILKPSQSIIPRKFCNMNMPSDLTDFRLLGLKTQTQYQQPIFQKPQ
jgi:hypothetical protein